MLLARLFRLWGKVDRTRRSLSFFNRSQVFDFGMLRTRRNVKLRQQNAYVARVAAGSYTGRRCLDGLAAERLWNGTRVLLVNHR